MRNILLAITILAFSSIANSQAYPATFFRLPTDSMAPEIPRGSLIVIEPATKELHRGDVIAFEGGISKSVFVKRVVAVQNNRIENTPHGLMINGIVQSRFDYKGNSESTRFSIDIEYPALGEAITVDRDHFYVLSNSADDYADSRRLGPISIKQLKGKAYLWADVLKVDGWPKVFFSRAIANIKTLLPVEIEDGIFLESLSIKGDRTINSLLRMKSPGDQENKESRIERLAQGRKAAYCKSSFGPNFFDVAASYAVLTDSGESISEFEFVPSNCEQ
jgi:signal peptidase I